MADPDIADVIKDITADVTTIVRGEIELAKVELTPQVKRAGLGAGLFGAAGYLAIQAVTLLFICAGLALSALYLNVVPLIWAFTLGFLTMAVLVLLIAGVLMLLGKHRFDGLTGPTHTVDQANRTVTAVTDAVARGQAEVAALAPWASKPSTEPPASVPLDAGVPRS